MADDDLATLVAEAGLSAEPASDDAPVTSEPTAAGIEKKSDDSRIAGFQTALNRKDTELKETRTALAQMQAQIEEMRIGSMSEDERFAFQRKKESDELTALRQKLAIYELASEYPDEVPAFQRLLAAKDAVEQLQVLRELRSPAKPAEAEAEQPPVPGVDPNNPRRTQKGEVLPDGTVMTSEYADRILKATPRDWFKNRDR